MRTYDPSRAAAAAAALDATKAALAARPAPVPSPAPAVAVPSPEVAGGYVDPAAAARIAAQEVAMRSRGFAPSQTLFTPGTAMLSSGEAKAKAYAADIRALPLWRDVAGATIARIEGERRQDTVLPLGGLRLGADGLCRVTHEGKTRAAWLTPHALAQLCARANGRGAGISAAWAAAMSPAIRAAAINEALDEIREALNDAPMTFRTRMGANGAEIFAIVGPRFPGRATDADRALRAALEATAGDPNARGMLSYDAETTEVQARIVWGRTTWDQTPRVGDPYRAETVIRTRDDAGGRFGVDSALLRLRCINATVSEAVIGEDSFIHRGDGDRLWTRAAEAIHRSVERVSGLCADMGILESRGAAEDLTTEEGWNVYMADGEALALALKDAGVGRDFALQRLLSASRAEPEAMAGAAGVIHAITRAAHAPDFDAWQQLAIERAAGALVPILARPQA